MYSLNTTTSSTPASAITLRILLAVVLDSVALATSSLAVASSHCEFMLTCGNCCVKACMDSTRKRGASSSAVAGTKPASATSAVASSLFTPDAAAAAGVAFLLLRRFWLAAVAVAAVARRRSSVDDSGSAYAACTSDSENMTRVRVCV